MKISFGNLYPSTLGFETVLRDIEALMDNSIESINDKFPPHNIIKINDTAYAVELAVAGFKQSEIDITVKDGLLVIKGEKSNPHSETQYLHKGISNRSFTKSIRLADTIEVQGATLNDGILSISLENIIPESKKPKRIEIKEPKSLDVSKIEKSIEAVST
ncbi:MAG: Hsp20 family protein [Proteobacteria bacterium]|jgi:molecular chaperone IbpA|nr:Hsp20 family protein [Pseudomonadota bacterium]MDA0942232.1 Hsp20 family protein [Pseudomonadota bacterium]MDA1034982.1 Hsp20 family protein [Pseudomonadota bacterium]